jgi:hypothetical protein
MHCHVLISKHRIAPLSSMRTRVLLSPCLVPFLASGIGSEDRLGLQSDGGPWWPGEPGTICSCGGRLFTFGPSRTAAAVSSHVEVAQGKKAQHTTEVSSSHSLLRTLMCRLFEVLELATSQIASDLSAPAHQFTPCGQQNGSAIHSCFLFMRFNIFFK